MIVDDGVVYRKFERPTGGVLFYQLLVPKSMRAELLELIHAGAACHLDVRKTIDQVQCRAYWFYWRSDTDRFCRRCVPCNQYAKGRVPRPGLLQDMREAPPWTESSWISLGLTFPSMD